MTTFTITTMDNTMLLLWLLAVTLHQGIALKNAVTDSDEETYINKIDTPDQPEDVNIAFHAVRTSPLEADTEPLKVFFQEVPINVGNTFRPPTSEFVCPVAGNYFFSIGAAMDANTPVNMTLRVNGMLYANLISKTSNNDGIGMLERSVVIELAAGDIVDVIIDANTTVYSIAGEYQTSFTGFILPSVSENEAALFAVAINDTSSAGDLIFDERLLETGNWGSEVDSFSYPYDGIYYTFHSSGCRTNDSADVVYVSGIGEVARSVRQVSESEAYETSSSGFILEVEMDNNVRVESPHIRVTDIGLTMALGSFKIAENDELPSVYIASDAQQEDSGIIPFDTIFVANNVEVSMENGTITCIVPGLYFVKSQVRSHSSGNTTVNMYKNSDILFSLTKNYIPASQSLSKVMLVYLDVGDELYLELVYGRIWTIQNGHTIAAFLLYPSSTLMHSNM